MSSPVQQLGFHVLDSVFVGTCDGCGDTNVDLVFVEPDVSLCSACLICGYCGNDLYLDDAGTTYVCLTHGDGV